MVSFLRRCSGELAQVHDVDLLTMENVRLFILLLNFLFRKSDRYLEETLLQRRYCTVPFETNGAGLMEAQTKKRKEQMESQTMTWSCLLLAETVEDEDRTTMLRKRRRLGTADAPPVIVLCGPYPAS